MFSPVEQAVLNSIVLLIIGMVFLASYFYLPDHVVTVARRATFYFFGNESVPGVVSRSALHDGLAETLRAKAEL